MSPNPKILLTGLPGCGKTTAVMKIIAGLDRRKVTGFYTQEIRENDARKGFCWTTLDGDTGILAHVDIKSPFKVGKYRVDVTAFETSVLPILDPARTDPQLFVIDEIGKMECFSKKFIDAVRRLFDSHKAVLGTVAQKGGGLIAEIKAHPHGEIFNLTRKNRDALITRILARISSFGTS